MSEQAQEPVVPIPDQIAGLEARIAALEASVIDVVTQHVDKVAGPAASRAVKPVLQAAVKELTELVTAATSKVEGGADIVDSFAHAKIGALHTAIERAIGITIPMPERTGGQVDAPKVMGAETAAQLEKGKG